MFSCFVEAVEWKLTLCYIFNCVTQLAYLLGGLEGANKIRGDKWDVLNSNGATQEKKSDLEGSK